MRYPARILSATVLTIGIAWWSGPADAASVAAQIEVVNDASATADLSVVLRDSNGNLIAQIPGVPNAAGLNQVPIRNGYDAEFTAELIKTRLNLGFRLAKKGYCAKVVQTPTSYIVVVTKDPKKFPKSDPTPVDFDIQLSTQKIGNQTLTPTALNKAPNIVVNGGGARDTAIDGRLVCSFDANGDDVPDLVIRDEDGDGFCDFPTAKTHFHGPLECTSCNPIKFTGSTVLEADTIVVESDAMQGDATDLRKLTLVALDGDFESAGSFDLGTADDLSITSRTGSIVLDGDVHLVAADRLVLDARGGDVVVTATPPVSASDLTISSGNRVDIRAKNPLGSIDIEGARIGSRRITMATRAGSIVGPKVLRLGNGAELTTDLAENPTVTNTASDVTLDATGAIILDGAQLDSGHNVKIQTARDGDALCLANGSVLEALGLGGVLNNVDVRGVRGGAFDDGSTIVDGQLRGLFLAGPCP
jgi:hypothetical protein